MAEAGRAARAKRWGLWADPTPVAPWNWQRATGGDFTGTALRREIGRARMDGNSDGSRPNAQTSSY